MKSRIAVFVIVIQSILLATHWFLYQTWNAFFIPADPPGIPPFEIAIYILAISFVLASLLAWRFTNIVVRTLYKISAAWLGIASFCLFAACACWGIEGIAQLFGLHPDRRLLAELLFSLAFAVGVYGIVNAAWTRVRRVSIQLPNLPESWRGRVAALVSDTHLGHVRGLSFMRRVVAIIRRHGPDIVFIAGDMYDGTAVKADQLAAPWAGFSAPLGTYFVTGNHEEFSDPSQYVNAIERSGVRVLKNEKIEVDGMQIIGVPFHDSTSDERFRAVLREAKIDRGRASILLTHAPDRLQISEEEGVSLQLSGHTHGGQFAPYTWITSRIYGRFVYGLQRLRNLMVYTSYGAGTWGPPLRVGTTPEIVLIQFE